MKKQLVSISPLRAGIVLGVLYGAIALLIVPFFVVIVLIGNKTGSAAPAAFGLGFAIMLPVFYAVLGFIGGVISAFIYNLIAKWTGGLEFEVRDVIPTV